MPVDLVLPEALVASLIDNRTTPIVSGDANTKEQMHKPCVDTSLDAEPASCLDHA